MDAALARWLTDADPSLVWQVQRDLLGAPEEVWRATGEAAGEPSRGLTLVGTRVVAWWDAERSAPEAHASA